MRRVLVVGFAVLFLLCGGGSAAAVWTWQGLEHNTAGKVDFVRPLAVPALAPSRLDERGRRVFELTARRGRHDFGNGPVATWGFNGDYLGPTLRAKRGEEVVVNVHNRLTEATTVHWHGMHLPAEADGGPLRMVDAPGTWSPTWRINQPAATLWYHPHPHGSTANQTYQGLAGMFILDDPATDVAALPHEYGVDDVPVIVQDKNFDGDHLKGRGGVFGAIGILGDTVVVNGTAAAFLDVTTDRVRLRLLNASNARVYDFGFADNREYDLVGTDGGLLAAPVTTRRVMLSPGERAEIVVAVRPGERVVLRSTPPTLGAGALSDRISGGHDTLDILQLRAAATLRATKPVPARLVDVPRFDRAAATRTRDFSLADTKINGQSMSMSRVDARVVKDTVEVWRVRNADGQPHTFHVHDVQFQVLSVGGKEPPAELRGWKDTIYLRGDVTYEIIMAFRDYADPNRAYMFHCHVLKHEDQGMMGQFVVVDQ
ncbi:multicopper oxidase domain-containing protein [Luedemannella flava]|uniref:Multicopper oxidase domain-containing protein n=1 Tax=Luedemannella flava TaxID=349316 RepID=A0ABP4YJ12_9ACTN